MRNLTKLSAMLSLVLMMSPVAVVTADVFDVDVGPGGAIVFEPSDLVIEVGDSVRWTWDSGGHNVGSGLPGAPTPFFLSGPPDVSGTIFEVLFDQAFLDANPAPGGVYDYHCHPHGDFGMIGTVTVVPEPAALLMLGIAGIFTMNRRCRVK